MAKTTVTTKQKKSWLKIGLLTLNIVLLVGLATTSAVFFKKYQDINNEQKLTQDQKNDQLLKEIAKVYELPKDEKPTIFTVSDEQKFKQEYKSLSMAKQGDVLLVYKDASLAVLYRPSDKKVLSTPTIKIPLGIQLVGTEEAMSSIEKLLAEKVPTDAKVTTKTSTNTPNASTVVVDVSGKRGTAAQQLAQLVGGTVGKLPEGQKPADGADIVILVASSAPQP